MKFHLISVAAALFAAFPAFAKLPELDAVYWGTVSHRTNVALIPVSSGQIVVQARLNGLTIAQSALLVGSNAFVLKIPLDDGVEPRLPGTARFGERVHVFVRNTISNMEYEAVESTGLGISLNTVKGAVTLQNFSVSGDLSAMTPSLVSYALWKSNYPSLAPGTADANQLAVGRDLTNYQAYVAGLDPTNPKDIFQILEVRPGNGLNSIRFGPIRLSRVYQIYASPDMLNWSSVGSFVPVTPADDHWHDHVVNGPNSNYFYKVEVGIQ